MMDYFKFKTKMDTIRWFTNKNEVLYVCGKNVYEFIMKQSETLTPPFYLIHKYDLPKFCGRYWMESEFLSDDVILPYKQYVKKLKQYLKKLEK